MRDRTDLLAGVILGTAVGDALGLPREGLSGRRARRLYGGPPLRHQFLPGRGMTSDDTEHTCLLAQALLAQPEDADAFARRMAWALRGWLLTLPAGVGWATLRACLRLCLGFSPHRSGVYSAGNGPAMRSALLGVCLGAYPQRLQSFARASTRLTHTDPRAELGALLVALAARLGAMEGPGFNPVTVFDQLRGQLPGVDAELAGLLDTLAEHLRQDAPVETLARALGQQRGVSGYVYRTVPVVLYAWLRARGDFRSTVEATILLGGDADTTGAIAGALAGATGGARAIPAEWLHGLGEWPRTVCWMRDLATRLSVRFPAGGPGQAVRPVPLFWPGLWPRNLFFLLVVLFHVARRLLPPY